MVFDTAALAKKFGKHDLERLGIFIEMPYIRPKPTKKLAIYEPEIQYGFMTNPMKTKCGNQDGYFESSFKRLHIGDKPRVVKRTTVKTDKLPFIPAGPSKKHSTPDDYYGCFTEPLEHFILENRTPRKKPKGIHERNPMSNPPKKGGPGFLDITINPFPEYQTNRPEPGPIKSVKERKKEEASQPKKLPFYTASAGGYFDDNPFLEGDIKHQIYISPAEREKMSKNKKEQKKKTKTFKAIFIPNGPHYRTDGYLNEFPEYRSNRRKKKPIIPPKTKRPFYPASGPKTIQWRPVLQNTDFWLNVTNYQSYQPQYVTYL